MKSTKSVGLDEQSPRVLKLAIAAFEIIFCEMS